MGDVNSLNEEMPWTANGKEKMRFIFDTGFLSDATLYLGPQKQKVKVHRFVLEFASPIFYRDFKQVRNNELVIEKVDPERFIKFLLCEVPVEECLPLLDIATKYEVQNLMDFYVEKLNGNISLKNVTTLFQQAMEFGHQSLREATLDYFCKSAKMLIKKKRFLELRQECLYEILKSDDLRVSSEIELFDAVLRCGEAECERQKLDPELPENLGKVLLKVLGLIRFPNMKAEEFSLKVATKKLLGNEEVISLLLFFNVSIEKRKEIIQKRFNCTPRKYSKAFDKTKIYTVSRVFVIKGWSRFKTPCSESLQLEVNKQICLMGLKLFVHPCWKEDISNDFSNFSCTISIERLQGGTFLHLKEVNEFNFFKTIDLESVELKPNSLYRITLSCRGTCKMYCRDGSVNKFNDILRAEGLQSSCDLEYQGEEEN